MPPSRRGSGFLLFLALASVSAAGCSSPPTGTVSGKVMTSDGKPLPKGLITFLSEVGNKDVFNAAIVNGKYVTSEIPAGPAKVVIAPALERAGGAEVPLEKGNDLAPRPNPADAKKRIEVPVKYQNADTSGLQLIVQTGENTFDVDLRP
jgi:hypothetical protein